MIEAAVDHSLKQGPKAYWTPDERPTLDEANAWCKALTGSHYENFHVATFFLPKEVRPHFESIYAYCRVADDLGDEVADTETAKGLLTAFGEMLNECYDAPERSMHPIFVALRETVVACDLPREPFLDLLVAFQMDQVKTTYHNMGELMEYSRYSANPVGRLVLMVCGYREETLALLSDKVCTALQLANFWQDVVEDAERGRRYLPGEVMERCGVDEGQILGRVFTGEFALMMQSLVAETRAMLAEGGVISQHVDGELRVTLDLFRKGGEAILDGIEAQGYDVLRGRPVVTKAKKAMLLAGALWAKFWAGGKR
ncbi:squalene synthase HpnC [Granulicella pectinivorans]|jgi:squalene synthase HpnC|uniref:Squalene synthase HpnC n=1 Tax=Granulicella pectinivorans TaxID=474950 RepID=A0A1I6MMR4_9BACT|nr:squalene synthase HpnC [Granulicella pectinivorans]SFS16941.1 squalene synthase HpnC [Granulicella pectinivorans]